MQDLKENLIPNITETDFEGFAKLFVNTKPFYPDDYVEEMCNKILKRIVIHTESSRAILILSREGKLSIESEVRCAKNNQISTTSVDTLKSTPINALLPMSILYEAHKFKKPIYLPILQTNNLHNEDYYLAVNTPSAIFCSGVFNDETLQGFLYLESQKEHVFNSDKKRIILQTWIDQVSISLENIDQFDKLKQQLREKKHELNTAKQDIKNKNSARIQFLADMNHEIRAPLNTIVGFSQLLMQKGHQLQLPPEFKDHIKSIQTEGLTLTEVMDNILEVSRIDSDRFKLEKEEIDIRLLIRGIFHANRHYTNQLGIKLKFVFNENLIEILYSDRSALNQLLMILVKNCIKRTSIGKTVVIGVGSKSNETQISVEYDGKSFPINNGTTPSPSSAENADSTVCDFRMGTELEIAKRIIERLNIKLDQPKLNDFKSVISLRFPASPVIAKKIWNNRVDNPSRFASGNRIIVFREEKEKDRILDSMLKELGISPVICNTHEQLLNNLSTLDPQLAIFDIHLLSNCKIWKEIDHKHSTIKQLKRIPVILITNEKLHKAALGGKGSIDVEVLLKPLNMTLLFQKLRKHLNSTPHGQINPDKSYSGSNHPARIKSSMVETSENRFSTELSEESLIRDFETLSSTPIFKGRTLINQLKRMKQISEKLFPSYLSILSKMEAAIFDGNETQLNMLIKSVLSEKPSKLVNLPAK